MTALDRIDRRKPLTVGDAAERAGVAVSAIHFYERIGLISGWRTAGNQRRYERSVLRRIAVIQIAQRTGMPLSEIKTALSSLPEGRTPTATDWRALSARWRGELDDRIASLIALRDQLDGCIGCGCLSVRDCPLRNPGDRLKKAGPGAHLAENGS